MISSQIAIFISLTYFSSQNHVEIMKGVEQIAAYRGHHHVNANTGAKPLIGILTLPLSDALRGKLETKLQDILDKTHKEDKHEFYNRSSFMAMSYPEWLQEFNVDTMPLDINADEKLLNIMVKLDGLLLTGGSAPIYLDSQIKIDTPNSNSIQMRTPSRYTELVASIVEKAKEINKTRRFPIWCTCLGFESILITESNYTLGLNHVRNLDNNSSVNFTGNGGDFKNELQRDKKLFHTMQNQKVFYFNHNWAFKTENFINNQALKGKWELVATAETKTGHDIVAIVKATQYPFYAVQFHPEKIEFETSDRVNADRSSEAVDVAHKLADIFVKSIDTKNLKGPHDRELLQSIDKENYLFGINNIGVFNDILLVHSHENPVKMRK